MVDLRGAVIVLGKGVVGVRESSDGQQAIWINLGLNRQTTLRVV